MAFESVVLAGGGSRCLWQAGFWREAAEPLSLAPRQFATVSAGSAIGCAIVAGLADETLRLFKEVTRKNRRNFYPAHLLGGRPAFPHYAMYRGAMLDLVDDTVLGRLKKGPDLRVLIGRLPRWLGPRAGLLAAAAAYNFDKRVRRLVHPETPRRIGFEPETVRVAECETPEALADLVLASSCTPPMTPLLRWKGQYALDGGVIDNVPLCALDESPGETLVLLSRPHLRLPQVPGRTYVQPSRPVGISAWDYTSPDKLQRAYDLGRRDGAAFVDARKSSTSRPVQAPSASDDGGLDEVDRRFFRKPVV